MAWPKYFLAALKEKSQPPTDAYEKWTATKTAYECGVQWRKCALQPAGKKMYAFCHLYRLSGLPASLYSPRWIHPWTSAWLKAATLWLTDVRTTWTQCTILTAACLWKTCCLADLLHRDLIHIDLVLLWAFYEHARTTSIKSFTITGLNYLNLAC